MKRFFKWLGIGIGGLLALAVGVILVLGAKNPLQHQFPPVEVQPVAVPDNDPEALARGEYLANALAVCTICHGWNLGGQMMVDHPVFGSVKTPNLTSGEGGIAQYYTDEDWVRALRHGIDPDGIGIGFMPTDYYWHLTDEDLGALIAYIKSVPPIDNTGARSEVNVLTKAILNSGHFGQIVRAHDIDHDSRPEHPETEAEYLLQVTGCTFCHGADYKGGQGPELGAPPAPDITSTGMDGWTFEQFEHTMRTGELPDGRRINPLHMPYAGYRNIRTEDMRAMWDYLRAQ